MFTSSILTELLLRKYGSKVICSIVKIATTDFEPTERTNFFLATRFPLWRDDVTDTSGAIRALLWAKYAIFNFNVLKWCIPLNEAYCRWHQLNITWFSLVYWSPLTRAYKSAQIGTIWNLLINLLLITEKSPINLQ